MTSLASQLLEVEIDLAIIKEAKPYEVEKIILSHAVIQQARDDFLNGLLTWEEYLELCEMHHINVDSYLETVNENLEAVGIIV